MSCPLKKKAVLLELSFSRNLQHKYESQPYKHSKEKRKAVRAIIACTLDRENQA